jgi:hypothetical protein
MAIRQMHFEICLVITFCLFRESPVSPDSQKPSVESINESEEQNKEAASAPAPTQNADEDEYKIRLREKKEKFRMELAAKEEEQKAKEKAEEGADSEINFSIYLRKASLHFSQI